MLSLLREMMNAMNVVYQMDVCENPQKLAKVLHTSVYQLAVLDVQAEGFAQVASFLSPQDKAWLVLLGVKEVHDY